MLLAHISDLHVGKDESHNAAAAALARSLAALDPDWVACTGDVTESGFVFEKVAFDRAFAAVRPRMTIVPGNHDRGGNDAAAAWAKGPVWVERPPDCDVSLVCIDSTSPMNAIKFMASGDVDERQRKAAVVAVRMEAERGRTPLVLLHHHVFPLPPDGPMEAFAEWGDLPFLEALGRGRQFVAALGVAGAKAVMHGHKHKPAEKDFGGVLVVNAGSTTESRAYRLFEAGRGEIVDMGWQRY